MAILIKGMTCPLCNQLIAGNQAYRTFPHFVANANDPLFALTDAGVHISCFNRWPYNEKFLYHLEKSQRQLTLVTTHYSAAEVRDIIFWGLLTSDELDPLYAFNYIVLHKSEVPSWAQRERFMQVAGAYLDAGKWGSLSENYNVLKIHLDDVRNL